MDEWYLPFKTRFKLNGQILFFFNIFTSSVGQLSGIKIAF